MKKGWDNVSVSTQKEYTEMKNLLYGVVFLAANLFLIGCGPSIKVGYDYDTEKNFSEYKTYDFLTNPDNTQMKELTLKRVKQAIIRELSPKGLVQSTENPDLLIAIHTDIRSKAQIATYGYYYSPYAVYWSSYGYYGAYNVEVREFQKGTLVLDFVDSKSKLMVWQGVGEGALPEIPRTEQIEKIVNKAVKEIIKKYPPPKAK